MGIGVSIFLIAVGLILAFAVNASIAGIDVEMIGWILAGVGCLGLILSLIFTVVGRRSRTEVYRETPAGPVVDVRGQQTYVDPNRPPY